MDSFILNLSIGLGLHRIIGEGNFVSVYYLGLAAATTNVLPILLNLFLQADYFKEYKKYKLDIQGYRHSVTGVEQYDFVIVGGGAAGCVLANRLSKYFTVLLIERGGDPNPLTFVPGLESVLLSRKETDYMFLTSPQQSSCLACNERRAILNQGKGLGGSGILNSMVYQRGHPYDYDSWGYHTGDKRWNYKNVLKYFLRSENYCFECEEAEELRTPTNDNYHGTHGELPIMKPYAHVPLLKHFLKAVSWAGIQIRDLNAPYYSSSANVAMYNQKDSRRASAYSSFIEPIAWKRKNLKIWSYTRAIKVLFQEKSENQAYAVQYERFGVIGVVKAKLEVVISAGAINSPKILMQSGIGNADLLQSHNIPVRCHLPAVGENFQDHVGTFVGPVLINKPLSYIFERDVGTYESTIRFLYNGTGPLALPFPVANAFWTSSVAVKNREDDWPDVQVGFAPFGVSSGLAEALSRTHNLRRDILDEFLFPVSGQDGFFLIVDYGRPKSRGIVKLKSGDYRDDPIIDPKYYEDEENEDLRVTVEALQNACYLSENAPAFKKLGARLSHVPFPTCKDKPFKSSSYWACLTKSLTLSFHHYAGTCAMGPVDSKTSVVDSELRVIGVKRLRVIDSSVIPFLTSANTHAPTIMIAERGADLILHRWKKYIVKKGYFDEQLNINKEYEKYQKMVNKTPNIYTPWKNKLQPFQFNEEKVKINHHQIPPIPKVEKPDFTRMGWEDPLTWFSY